MVKFYFVTFSRFVSTSGLVAKINSLFLENGVNLVSAQPQI